MNGLHGWTARWVLAGAVTAVVALTAPRAGAAQNPAPLTAGDRAAIQQLSATYAEVLGACKAEEYAALFAADGYFASGFRGRVQGREPLIKLVQSERHCIAGTPRAASGVPVMTIEASADGATGRAMLANDGGAYEDVYVKTPAGWRFRSRTHVTMKELAARSAAVAAPALSPLDYVEIRQLVARYAYAVDTGAGNGDVYASLFAPDGAFVDRTGREITGRDALVALARRNTRGPQSAFHFIVNHIIEPSPEGAVGRQFLLQLRIGESDRPNEVFGGGHYRDVYVKTADGWRFKRRQYLPSERMSASAQPAPFGMPAAAQAGGESGAAGLTALDYLELEQLTYRYGYALDTGADNGYAYADLFTPDGTFTGTNQGPNGRSYTGRDALAALARGGRRGPRWVSHYVTNVVIEPASDGAVGRTYVAIFDIGNGGNGARSSVSNGGLYNDVYVKTPSGWRFKSRTFYASKSGEPVQPPPAVVGTPKPLAAASRSTIAVPPPAPGRLTAEDHIAIQQLVARYAYALDQNGDNGQTYANLFTADAVFRQPRTEGRENLAKLATSAPHGPHYTRHFITNHIIEPTADGATGKQYLVVVDIGESGQPSSIFLGGHYEDVYARTPDGWRFRARTFIASATGGTP